MLVEAELIYKRNLSSTGRRVARFKSDSIPVLSNSDELICNVGLDSGLLVGFRINTSSSNYAVSVYTSENKEEYGNGKDITGFIAEEMYDVIPEIVQINSEGLIQGYNDDLLVPFLVKELQDLKKEVEELKNR